MAANQPGKSFGGEGYGNMIEQGELVGLSGQIYARLDMIRELTSEGNRPEAETRGLAEPTP